MQYKEHILHESGSTRLINIYMDLYENKPLETSGQPWHLFEPMNANSVSKHIINEHV